MAFATSQITSGDILLHYFDSGRVKSALAVMMIGTGLGRTVHPILVQYLFDKFDYSVSMVILGSFMIVHVLGGLTYIETEEGCRINAAKGGTDKLQKQGMGTSILKDELTIMFQNCKVRWVDLCGM